MLDTFHSEIDFPTVANHSTGAWDKALPSVRSMWLCSPAETGLHWPSLVGRSIFEFLQSEVTNGQFAVTEQGMFTRVAISLQQPIRIRKNTMEILAQDDPKNRTTVVVEALIPCSKEFNGPIEEWSLIVSIPGFSAQTLEKRGKISDLVEVIDAGQAGFTSRSLT